jgi:hypothetical protein
MVEAMQQNNPSRTTVLVDRKNGLTREEWLDLYQSEDWAIKAVAACKDIAACPHAIPADRAEALDLWGNLLSFGYADDPHGTYPRLCRDVHLSALSGRPVDWNKEIRDACSERLQAIKIVLLTIGGLIDMNEIRSRLQAASGNGNVSFPGLGGSGNLVPGGEGGAN